MGQPTAESLSSGETEKGQAAGTFLMIVWLQDSTLVLRCDFPKSFFLRQALEKVGLKWSMLATTSWDSMFDTLCEYVEAKVSVYLMLRDVVFSC